MTNTLHRHGNAGSFANDYIVFAIPCRGYNEQGCVPRLREFLRRALRHHPVNWGDASHGAIFRPTKKLTPFAHWVRSDERRPEEVIEGVDTATTVAAVFDNPGAVENFLRELRGADLGLSVNVSATIEGARHCCRNAGLVRHSVEYSLPYMGNTEKLPEPRVLEIATMCGHGMVSFDFTRKMLDWVRAGRRTPDQTAGYLARFCSCGIFNPCRAAAIFRQAQPGR
ncbi:MAG: hypothetical protein ABIG68_08870 [Acidobacteriota bacterium]